MILGPIELEVFLDERGAISIGGVDVFDGIALGRAAAYQSVDLVIARGVEECAEDILAIAQKILRPSAHDDAGAFGERLVDCRLRNGGDATRVDQSQAVRGGQASLECSAKKGDEDSINCGIFSPFHVLDRLRRTLCQTSDFLRQAFVPELPPEPLGEQLCNLRSATTELTLNCD